MKRGLCLLLATAAALPAACVIGGTVRDADTAKPLPRARVFARAFGDSPAILRVTDAVGLFCFEQLLPNTYEMVAEKAGYLVSVYGARPGNDEGIPFEVEAQTKVRPLTIRMVAGATIAGTVFDPEGQPLTEANVQLSRKVWEKGWTTDRAADTRSGADGGFRFSMLSPGTYYLSVSPRRGDSHGRMLDEQGRPIHRDGVETYYAGGYTFAQATPIPLKAGQENTGLVVTSLRPASRHLSGQLSPEFRSGEKAAMLELALPGSMGDTVEVAIGKDGTFSAADLAPALYQFWVYNVDPGVTGRVDLSGGDVNGFVIEPQPMVKLRVSVRVENRPAPANLRMAAIGRETSNERTVHMDEPGVGESNEAGVCQFDQLLADVYRFEPRGPAPSRGIYVKRVLVDGRPQPDVFLDLRKGVPGKVELVLGSNPASLDGSLDLREGEAHALAITVVAVDETRSGAELKYETAVADHTGGFALSSVPPGKWRVFAIEGFEEGPWGSLELAQALRGKSVAVDLQEGRSITVKVSVTGTDEWEAALRKVGM